MENASGPLSAERATEVCASLIDMARIKAGVTKRPTICFDAWNICKWATPQPHFPPIADTALRLARDPVRAPGDKGAEELYTVSDTLAMGVWCNVFIRQSTYLGTTNTAQSANVIAPLVMTPTGPVKQTMSWVYLLFAKRMRGRTLGVHVKSGTYDVRTNPVFIESTMDVSAAVNNGYVNLAVVILNAEKAFETELKGVLAGQNVEVHLITGENLNDVNTADKTTVEIKESKYTFPKHSFNLLRWEL